MLNISVDVFRRISFLIYSSGWRCKILSSSSQCYVVESVPIISRTINCEKGLIEVSMRLNMRYLGVRPSLPTSSSGSIEIYPIDSILSFKDSFVTTGYSANIPCKFFKADVFG